jgi:hypothetical protein
MTVRERKDSVRGEKTREACLAMVAALVASAKSLAAVVGAKARLMSRQDQFALLGELGAIGSRAEALIRQIAAVSDQGEAENRA